MEGASLAIALEYARLCTVASVAITPMLFPPPSSTAARAPSSMTLNHVNAQGPSNRWQRKRRCGVARDDEQLDATSFQKQWISIAYRSTVAIDFVP
jgi:hypothetical protein